MVVSSSTTSCIKWSCKLQNVSQPFLYRCYCFYSYLPLLPIEKNWWLGYPVIMTVYKRDCMSVFLHDKVYAKHGLCNNRLHRLGTSTVTFYQSSLPPKRITRQKKMERNRHDWRRDARKGFYTLFSVYAIVDFC